jgi:hypothetical protein
VSRPRRPRPTPKYAFRIVARHGVAPYRVRVRAPDCHPDNRHYDNGECVDCYESRRRGPAAVPNRLRSVVRDTLGRGQRWQEHWPGARYQLLSDVPDRCPRERCGGALQETVTGAVCVNCGAGFHVAEALLRALLRGRDPSVMRSVESQ